MPIRGVNALSLRMANAEESMAIIGKLCDLSSSFKCFQYLFSHCNLPDMNTDLLTV